MHAGMPTPWYADPATARWPRRRHRRLDAGRAQQVVHVVLGQGVIVAHHGHLERLAGYAEELTQLLPGAPGRLLVAPRRRALVVHPPQ